MALLGCICTTVVPWLVAVLTHPYSFLETLDRSSKSPWTVDIPRTTRSTSRYKERVPRYSAKTPAFSSVEEAGTFRPWSGMSTPTSILRLGRPHGAVVRYGSRNAAHPTNLPPCATGLENVWLPTISIELQVVFGRFAGLALLARQISSFRRQRPIRDGGKKYL